MLVNSYFSYSIFKKLRKSPNWPVQEFPAKYHKARQEQLDLHEVWRNCWIPKMIKFCWTIGFFIGLLFLSAGHGPSQPENGDSINSLLLSLDVNTEARGWSRLRGKWIYATALELIAAWRQLQPQPASAEQSSALEVKLETKRRLQFWQQPLKGNHFLAIILFYIFLILLLHI